MYDIHDFKETDITAKSPKSKSEETTLEKKFPLTQLKELVGEFFLSSEFSLLCISLLTFSYLHNYARFSCHIILIHLFWLFCSVSGRVFTLDLVFI